MNFTDIFIRRPVLATVVSLLILVLGLRSINLLPVREYPATPECGGDCNNRLYRRRSRIGIRFHHHTAGKLHCSGQRHRLPYFVEFAKREYHYRQHAS